MVALWVCESELSTFSPFGPFGPGNPGGPWERVLQLYFPVIKLSKLRSYSVCKGGVYRQVAIHLPLRRSHGIRDIYHISHRQAASLFRIWQSGTRHYAEQCLVSKKGCVVQRQSVEKAYFRPL